MRGQRSRCQDQAAKSTTRDAIALGLELSLEQIAFRGMTSTRTLSASGASSTLAVSSWTHGSYRPFKQTASWTRFDQAQRISCQTTALVTQTGEQGGPTAGRLDVLPMAVVACHCDQAKEEDLENLAGSLQACKLKALPKCSHAFATASTHAWVLSPAVTCRHLRSRAMSLGLM